MEASIMKLLKKLNLLSYVYVEKLPYLKLDLGGRTFWSTLQCLDPKINLHGTYHMTCIQKTNEWKKMFWILCGYFEYIMMAIYPY
jgi:hypothetical protein